MQLIDMEGVLPPKDKRRYGVKPKKSLEDLFNKFLLMETKYARVDLKPGDYKTFETAYKSLRKAVIRQCVPVKVRMINREIYLTRTDM